MLAIALILGVVVFNSNTILYHIQVYQLNNWDLDKEKLWVHRVNSKERLEFLIQDFSGFEMDLEYNEQAAAIVVRHPPDTSTTYLLEDVFTVSGAAEKKWWFDLKEIRPAYKLEMIHQLRALREQYFPHTAFIMETADSSYLRSLKENKFTTSFNVSAARHTITSIPALQQLVGEADYLSLDIVDNDWVRENLTHKTKLVWCLALKSWLHSDTFDALLKDSSIAAVLVNVKSPYYR